MAVGAPNVVTSRYRPFEPFKAFHARTQRFALMVCTRRAGKTVACVHDMVDKAMATRLPNARYGYFAPNMKQGVRAAWDYFKQAVEGIPNVVIKESAKTIDLPNGARIELYSAEDPHSIRGGRWDGVVLDEYGDMKAIMWSQVVRAGIADRKGWVVFIGTPRGKNSFYKLRERARGFGPRGTDEAKRWFYMSLTAQDIIDNGGPQAGWGIWTQRELDDTRLDAADDDEFQQEYMCSFEASNRGTYYAKHIADLERRGALVDEGPDFQLYDPHEKVSLAIDFGFRDATAIWFWQVVNGEVRFIDYWEETGYDAEEVAEVLELKPYDYETWWIPHDALHHTSQSRKSILDQFRELNAPARKVPNPDAGNRVIHGVNAVRKTLRTYPLKFDRRRTARGIEALRNYSRKFNADDNVLAEKAKHDEWSHGADAFRYACLCFNQSHLDASVERWRRRVGTPKPIAPIPVNSKRTFDEAFVEHQQRLSRQRLFDMGRY